MHRRPTPELRLPPRPTTRPSDPVRRLPIPSHLPAHLGYDAVGTLPEHGERILALLPRAGCVYADDRRWWWIVPAGSQIDITWPRSTCYAAGARIADVSLTDTSLPDVSMADPSWGSRPRPRTGPGHPRLLHAPGSGSPYTPPLPLYFLTCRLAGTPPHWRHRNSP